MRIEIFIDDEPVPRQTLQPPATLELDTEGLADGPHRLRVHAIEDSGTVGVEEIPFTVRNGPGSPRLRLFLSPRWHARAGDGAHRPVPRYRARESPGAGASAAAR